MGSLIISVRTLFVGSGSVKLEADKVKKRIGGTACSSPTMSLPTGELVRDLDVVGINTGWPVEMSSCCRSARAEIPNGHVFVFDFDLEGGLDHCLTCRTCLGRARQARMTESKQ